MAIEHGPFIVDLHMKKCVFCHNDVSLQEGNPQKKDRNDEEVTMSFVWQWDFVDDFSLFDPFGGPMICYI